MSYTPEDRLNINEIKEWIEDLMNEMGIGYKVGNTTNDSNNSNIFNIPPIPLHFRKIMGLEIENNNSMESIGDIGGIGGIPSNNQNNNNHNRKNHHIPPHPS